MLMIDIYRNRVLGLSEGIDHPEGLQWELVGCLVLSWTLVYFCVWKGVKSSGKVVYFTALFPYIMITALLIRGLTLPGAINGLKFYVTPDFSKLLQSQVFNKHAYIFQTSISNFDSTSDLDGCRKPSFLLICYLLWLSNSTWFLQQIQ